MKSKMTPVLAAVVVAAALASIPRNAVALTPGGSGGASGEALVYAGSGHSYDAQRHPTGDYQLEVRVTATSATDESIAVHIARPDGTVFDETCTMSRNATRDRWHKVCAGGEGWGYFFDYGLGQEYYELPGGKAYVTSIVVDGPDRLRFSRTEIQGGVATQYFAEELTRR